MLSAKLKEAAGNSADATLYVDDVFSTYLYTGNGSTQTITNGIDLAGKGGMTWIKSRSAATDHKLTDTVRGATKALISNTTGAETTDSTGLTAFSSTGFSLGANSVYNTNAATYASYSFCKKSNFFDVQTVTHTNGTANNINLSVLGTLGMVIAKITTTTGDWDVWHRSLTAGNNFQLNTTSPQSTTNAWLSVSGTTATLSASAPTGTYVIYGYAHDTSSTGIIQCGLITTDASGVGSTTLGWEPQFIFTKSVSANSSNSFVTSSMQGMSLTGSNWFYADTASAEQVTSPSSYWTPNATGFSIAGHPVSSSIVYMAIRRPNKPPTSGTQVFSPVVSNATTGTITSGFPTDLVMELDRTTGTFTYNRMLQDRLRGKYSILDSSATAAEASNTTTATFDSNTGIILNGGGVYSNGFVYEQFKRASGFFDVVCYTGSASNININHNLTVVPELIIAKTRSGLGSNWAVYSASLGNAKALALNDTSGQFSQPYLWNSTTPTSTVVTLGGASQINDAGSTSVMYLFATLAGISKVGSYTGNGSSQNIECGFAAGARFVLIKRTDSTGDWFVWDTARGIVSANDPHLSLNTTAAEVTTDDSVDPYSAGFAVNQVAATNINVTSATYIFLAIA